MTNQSLAKILKCFCDDTTIHGCNFLTMEKMSKFERFCWLTFNILSIAISTFFVHHLWEDFINAPTILTLDSSNMPIRKVKFPGVSICNMNKISKRRAAEFAQHMNKFDTFKDMATILEDIKLLGNLYDMNSNDSEKLLTFHEFLYNYDNGTNIYDPTKRLITLAPSCREMLKECTWGGKIYDCKDIFRSRMTFDGFCCLFNYVRQSSRTLLYIEKNPQPTPKTSAVPQGAGIENGLKITLNDDLDDYFFTTTESTGYMVHIFYSQDFPDKISGSLTEVVVNLGTEAFISIDVDDIQSSAAMKAQSVNIRNCKFESDEKTMFGDYRHSDCLVDCKIKSVQSLCDCMPFSMPLQPGPTSICTLIDLPCLNKYKGKWSKYFPMNLETKQLKREMHDSLSCPKCLPACNTVVYNVLSNVVPVFEERANNTYINIYLNTAFADLYKMDLTLTWFEILSNFGGAISLLMGISAISLIEICVLKYRLVQYCINKINKSF